MDTTNKNCYQQPSPDIQLHIDAGQTSTKVPTKLYFAILKSSQCLVALYQNQIR